MNSHLKLILFFYLRYGELRERVYKPDPHWILGSWRLGYSSLGGRRDDTCG